MEGYPGMIRPGFKQKLVIAIAIIGIIIALIFLKGGLGKSDPSNFEPSKTTPPATISPNDKPQIVATKPDPLDENIITAAEVIEITFNRSLENVGEFKVRIEPNIDYKVELSGDRKTARIIPARPYQLNMSYTLYIGTETKFDGVGRWGEEKVFHFRTIKYTGV